MKVNRIRKYIKRKTKKNCNDNFDKWLMLPTSLFLRDLSKQASLNAIERGALDITKQDIENAYNIIIKQYFPNDDFNSVENKTKNKKTKDKIKDKDKNKNKHKNKNKTRD